MDLIYEHIRNRQIYRKRDFVDVIGGHVLLYKRVAPVWGADERTDTVSESFLDLRAVLEANRLRLRNETHEYRSVKVQPKTVIRIGRSSDNTLIVNHPSVSKLHAEVDVTATGAVRLIDCGSKNGTRVNHQPLPAHEVRLLNSGDMLHVGLMLVRFLDANDFYDQLGEMTEAND